MMNFSDYLAEAKKIRAGKPPADFKKLKVAYLSSFTTKGFEDVLFAHAWKEKIWLEFYSGGYNQFAQEILNPKSGLYTFEPDLVILFADFQTLAAEFYFRPYPLAEKDRKAWVDENVDQFIAFAEKIKAMPRVQLLVHNFEVPPHSPLGVLETKQVFGFQESVRALNRGLMEAFHKDNRVFVLDYDGFCSRIGKDNVADPKMYYLGDFKLAPRHVPALCREYMGLIKPMAGALRKCIVLDLDNTLWGGIVGEDGFDGIRLGPTPEGRPFWEFQKHLLALFERGVVLAVNSKNNPEEALRVIREHPNMVLREKHFAAIQINWNDKVENMKAIAAEINIGLDSLVFFDDSPVNREWIKKALPEVLTVDLPEDPSLYCQTLLQMNDFNTLQLTEEDQSRGASYASERMRQGLKKQTSLEDYLKSLGTVLTVEKAGESNLARIAQLTQKTNQFNMTTRRYLEEDIKRFGASASHRVYSFRLEDKFGDLGIIAAVILEKQKSGWRIDTFLMSCRVLGRMVEESILAFMQQLAEKEGDGTLTGEFISTEKNAPARDFYKQQGFKLEKQEGNTQIWHRKIKGAGFPSAVQVKIL